MSITKIQLLGIGGILFSFLIVVVLAYDYSQEAIKVGETSTNVIAPIQSDLQKTNRLLSNSSNAFLRFIHRDRITNEDVREVFGRLAQLEKNLVGRMQGRTGYSLLRERPARKARAAFGDYSEEELQDSADDTAVQLKSIVVENLVEVRNAVLDATPISQTEPRLKRHIEAYSNLATSADIFFRRYTLRDRINLNAAIQPVDQAIQIFDRLPVNVLDNRDHDNHQDIDLVSKSEGSILSKIRKALTHYRATLYSLADAEDSGATGTAYIESRSAAAQALYDSQIRVAVGTRTLDEHLRALQENTLASGRRHQREFLILAVVTLCFSMAFLGFMGSTITKRIGSLVGAVKRMSAGDFELQVKEHGNDAFGQLTGGFNAMAQELRAKEEALARRIAELDDTRRHLHEANEDLERRVAERTVELRQSEDRFKQFAASSSDWLWEQDENLRFTFLSNEVQSKSGLAAAAHIGKTRREVVHRGVTEEQWRQHQADLDARRPFRDFVFERIDENGTIQHISIDGVPIFDTNNRFRGYRGTATNITERKLMEADLIVAKQEAEAASHAKSAFLANMSHELRTPLNAIIGYAELMQEEAEDRDDDVLREDLTRVRNAGNHLLSMINNVLDLSKVEAGKMDVSLDQVDLEVLIAETADTVRPLMMEKDNVFLVDNVTEIRSLITDSQKLRQALLNLLSNAAKFTRSGEVRLSVCQDDQNWLRFEVSDTGVGMTEEQLSKVLDPFTQADSSVAQKYGGTGLGLAITKKFVEILGGQFDIESELGQGSRFTISLPIHQAEASGITALTA